MHKRAQKYTAISVTDLEKVYRLELLAITNKYYIYIALWYNYICFHKTFSCDFYIAPLICGRHFTCTDILVLYRSKNTMRRTESFH